MSTASTTETSTTNRLTLRLPRQLIRRVKAEAILQCVDPSEWAEKVFENALRRADISKSIKDEKHA